MFIWDVNDACPGHFLELFEPIENVIFIQNSSRCAFETHAKVIYNIDNAVLTWTLETNGVPKNRWGSPSWHEIEVKGYSLIIPKRSIMIKVQEFVKKYDICNSSSMHIRTTDLAKKLAASRKHLNIGSYENFVRYQQDNKPVFLMTDSPEAQSNFINQFGASKILTYHTIPGLADQVKVSEYKRDPTLISNPEYGKKEHYGKSNNNNNNNNNNNSSSSSSSSSSSTTTGSTNSDMKHISVQLAIGSVLPEAHRFTTLEHTLIDVLIAAHSREFKPAFFSSLSELVRTYSWIGKKKWGWCPHIDHRPHMIIK